MEKNVLNIYCPNCGTPAYYDIVTQGYLCRNCGGNITVEAAIEENNNIKKWITNDNYNLETTICDGCGSTIVFEESEALSKCEFCGRSLARGNYTHSSKMPKYVVPFGITPDEARSKLIDWCKDNSSKPEAKHLEEKLDELRGYYLPYEMVKGPVRCVVRKSSEVKEFPSDGYLNEEFINCSKQLDNLVLDAMEPFDLTNLQEFDFAYVAGHRVKVSDIDEKEIGKRLHDETEANYRAIFEKYWGTRSISMKTTVNPVIELPVLLPVYYISCGEIRAAVNGQTGKVSVRAEKASSYLQIPWWLKGIVVLLVALGATFGLTYLSGMELLTSLAITGMLGLFYLMVFFCMFQDGGSTEFGFAYYRKIFNSGEQTFRRDKDCLIPRDEVLKRSMAEPLFMRELEGKMTPVSYTFRSFKRNASMVLLSVITIFLPVICALLINGFDFERLEIAGSAVWLCIAVPVVPILLVRVGIQWLYENPAVYIFTEDGKRKRYIKKIKINKETISKFFKILFFVFFGLPFCIATWVFIIMVYLTAFGF